MEQIAVLLPPQKSTPSSPRLASQPKEKPLSGDSFAAVLKGQQEKSAVSKGDDSPKGLGKKSEEPEKSKDPAKSSSDQPADEGQAAASSPDPAASEDPSKAAAASQAQVLQTSAANAPALIPVCLLMLDQSKTVDAAATEAPQPEAGGISKVSDLIALAPSDLNIRQVEVLKTAASPEASKLTAPALPGNPDDIPLSAKAEVPVSTEVQVPISAKAEVPVSTKAEVPVSAKVQVPISAKVQVPISAKAEVPVSAKAEIPVNVKAEVPAAATTARAPALAASVPLSKETIKAPAAAAPVQAPAIAETPIPEMKQASARQGDESLSEGSPEPSGAMKAPAGKTEVPLDSFKVSLDEGQPLEKRSEKTGKAGGNGEEALVLKGAETAQRSEALQKPEKTDTVREPVSVQIVKQAREAIAQGRTELRIQLDPEHLGGLTLKVVSQNGVITAKIQADNSQTRELIDGQLAGLRNQFSEQGIRFDRVEVSNRNDSAFDASNPNDQQRSQEEASRRQARRSHFAEPSEAMPLAEEVSADGVVDYRA